MTHAVAENLVLGFATNIEPSRVELFARTLRDTYSDSECDAIIFTNRIDEEMSRIARTYAVQFAHTPNIFSRHLGMLSKLVIRSVTYLAKYTASGAKAVKPVREVASETYLQLMKLYQHPHFARWLSYRELLRFTPQYRRVLMSDVKDVAFQAPFFEQIGPNDVWLFEQDVRYGDGGHAHWDTTWYEEAYGRSGLERVHGKPCLCIGTILGAKKRVEQLVDLICADIEARPYGRIEQTILNWLYYNGKLAELEPRLHENAKGAVLTLTGQSWHRFEVETGGIVNADRALIPIVHMYDRHPESMRHFSTLLGRDLTEGLQ